VALTGGKISHVASAQQVPADALWQDVAEASIPAWGERKLIPRAYRTLRLDLDGMRGLLAKAPMEFTERAKESPVTVLLPLPDGTMGRFKAVESPITRPDPAGEPEIKTYSGQGIDDPTAITRFGITLNGFHAIILSTGGTIYIDTYAKGDTEHYISYFKQDFGKDETFRCFVEDAPEPARPIAPQALAYWGALRNYRVAVAASGEYTNEFRLAGDTDDQAKDRARSAIIATLNRVNSLFIRDVAVRLELIGRDQHKMIIYTDPNSDPYTLGGTFDTNCGDGLDCGDAGTIDCIKEENQCNLENVIGADNFDIGHVFAGDGVPGNNGGSQGIAELGSVCVGGLKGQGATQGQNPQGVAFDLDYVAHEIGHQFSATHTFNDNTNGACANANQRNSGSSYEPGSGSTVMGYAGTCGAADLQLSSDGTFHVKSILQIREFVTEDEGEKCNVLLSTPNLGSNVVLNLNYTIPSRTPFRLGGVDVGDPDGNLVTYSWEEYDLGAASPPEGDDGTRPIFRSYPPTLDSDRLFPSLQYILNNGSNPPATYNCGTAASPINCLTGETLPITTRTMTFMLTVRDNVDAVAIDHMTVNVVSGSGPFFVLSPGQAWTQGASRTVTWVVSGTDQPPINCANVKISLSIDGGNNFPYVLAESTPNDGSESITVPQVNTTQARIKVEAVGNIFFNITSQNFTIRPPTVTTTDDGSGDNLSPVAGSLREAIVAANNLTPTGAGNHVPISFDIPGGATLKTITLAKELPSINKPVFIDGWSQGDPMFTGPPIIELNGQSAAPDVVNARTSGLRINSGGSGSRIRGLIINRFTGPGIALNGSSNNIVEGCYIGTNAAGTARLPNGEDGVRIMDGSANQIGANGAPNLISGNEDDGVEISGATASGNIIANNYIGLNITGMAMLHNGDRGVHIINAPGTIIGGTAAWMRNVISGGAAGGGNAGAHGILIAGSSASGTNIRNNYIGTDAAGMTDLGNDGAGIYIDGAPGTVIGEAGEDEFLKRNVISGNNNYAQIYIIGSTATGTRIQNNHVGVNADGSGIISPFGIIGIHILSSNNLIGGAGSREGNVMSGNITGLRIEGPGASGNVVQGNFIGTDRIGEFRLRNVLYGIEIIRGRNNLIGGLTRGARNLISGNDSAGIFITGDSANPAEGNLIQGNWIGTNFFEGRMGNGAGVVLNSVKDVTIGGTAPGAGNVISANGDGILVSGLTLSGIVIQGNRVGTSSSGTFGIGNFFGIRILTGNVTVGGATPGARNVIAASDMSGIDIGGSGNNVVKGNLIGADINGTAGLPNRLSGIRITSNNNVIGGPAPGEGNVIAFNAPGRGFNDAGIQVAGISNTIRGNSIFSNDGLGIDNVGFLGVNANDNCDADTGANNLQNFPALSAAVNGAGNIRVEGTLNSTASSTFTLDFYSNPACDSSANGEGKTYLGSAQVVTAANCVASFTGENAITLAGVTAAAGQFVTATATDSAGNTSEFSACIQVTGLCAAISPTTQSFTRAGGSGSVNVTAAAGCNWAAVSNDAWIVIVSEPSGTGNETVSYEVRENFDAASRTGTMTIGGQDFTVKQSGNCAYSISPAQRTHPAGGGAGTINVTAGAGCAWSAASSATWITITSGNGTGNGVVNYTVAANPGPKGRVETITVGGRVFTVKQK
jgi:hypothetical protein